MPITEDELLDLKRTLTLLDAAIQNPGAPRYIAQNISLDQLTDAMIYMIENAPENVR